VRKGVYMDGHERQDVVDYRNKVFLPALKEFEKLVAKYERFDLDEEGKGVRDSKDNARAGRRSTKNHHSISR